MTLRIPEKSGNTRVVITLLLHDVIHWKTATSCDRKGIFLEDGFMLQYLITSI